MIYQTAYMTGRTKRVKIVAKNRPEPIATAIGPQNRLEMSGIMAKMAAAAVSRIGRRRLSVAFMIASQRFSPAAICWSIWSIRIIEFRIIMPDKASMPSWTAKPIGFPVKKRPMATPIRPRGAVSRVKIIFDMFCNCSIKRIIMVIIIAGIGAKSIVVAFALSSVAPSYLML